MRRIFRNITLLTVLLVLIASGCRAEELRLFAAQGDIACYEKQNKLGFVRTDGTIVTEAIYDGAWAFTNGYAVVRQDNRCGVIDSGGNEILPCMYDDIQMQTDVMVQMT